MPQMPGSRPTLTYRDVTDQLGYASEHPVRKLVADGYLRAFRIGSATIRFSQADVDALFTEVAPNGGGDSAA